MLKKFFVLILMLSLGLLVTTYIASNNEQSTDSKVSTISQAVTISITAGSDGLVVGTPIILNDLELISSLSLATVVVIDGSTVLPTQYDSELGKIVFQLPNTLEAHSSATFEVQGETTGSSNGQLATIQIGQGDYDATYDDWLPSWTTTTFMNGTKPANMVKAIGDVIWVETDWGILCLAVEADWRQGTWRHVIMKDTEWDAVGTHN